LEEVTDDMSLVEGGMRATLHDEDERDDAKQVLALAIVRADHVDGAMSLVLRAAAHRAAPHDCRFGAIGSTRRSEHRSVPRASKR
jgi:hypothetical protein